MQRLSILLALSLAACAHNTAATCGDTTPTAHTATATADSVAYVATRADGSPAPDSLRVTSDAFAEGAAIPNRSVFAGFGCTGDNHSPALAWSNAPPGTRSFAVVVHDPDAPTGTGFYHWVAYDLPAATNALPDNAGAAAPAGAHYGHTDFGADAYGGPCPPPGPAHRYRFTVYALDTDALGAPPGGSGALVRFLLRGHVLAYGTLTGTYARPQ